MKKITKFLSFKVSLWILILLVVISIGFYIYGNINAISSGTKSSYSMVQSIEKVNEQVFLNVGIATVISSSEHTEFPLTKIKIPLTEKKALIVVNYKAKLGIKKSVKIEMKKEQEYKIIVPKYEVIGISLDKDNPYKVYDNSGDILSYSTKDIDTGELVTDELSDEMQNKYLKEYKTQMDESAKEYYETLFKAVDTENKVEVVFE
ncbi:DUF4230 domain-containing protein [Enterococcus sp. AZ126]|uniref:DUF4230 domain-containing protein n=1 Tax=Enterococcus sp. AZ126 TaxID=2774635 RepID=UPI003F243915